MLRHRLMPNMVAVFSSGPGLALLSALLFGASTPLAKLLLRDIDPSMLAGFLYLGSGLGLIAVRPVVEEVRRINAYWRAANYLSVGQIYRYDNPLLREPLKFEHVKRRLLGARCHGSSAL